MGPAAAVLRGWSHPRLPWRCDNAAVAGVPPAAVNCRWRRAPSGGGRAPRQHHHSHHAATPPRSRCLRRAAASLLSPHYRFCSSSGCSFCCRQSTFISAQEPGCADAAAGAITQSHSSFTCTSNETQHDDTARRSKRGSRRRSEQPTQGRRHQVLPHEAEAAAGT